MSECIEWPLSRTKDGYPTYWDTERRCTRYAHRRAWEEANGPLPEDHQVHHTCFNRGCVNPEHLEAVHKSAHGALHRSERCQRGHLMEEANVYVAPDGGRRCRTCIREKARARKQRLREQESAQVFICLREDVVE